MLPYWRDGSPSKRISALALRYQPMQLYWSNIRVGCNDVARLQMNSKVPNITTAGLGRRVEQRCLAELAGFPAASQIARRRFQTEEGAIRSR